MRRPELGAIAGLIVVIMFFLWRADTSMFNLAGLMTILAPASELGILAIAAALLMIGGEFDLSIGSMMAFAGLVLGVCLVVLGWPFEAALAGAFAVAAMLGALNGQIVIRTKLPSFIVTLAFLFILRGLSLVGLKAATGGSTQLRGIADAAANSPFAGLFQGVAFPGAFQMAGRDGADRAVPLGAADRQRHARFDPLVRRLRGARDLDSAQDQDRQLDLRGGRRSECGPQFRRARRRRQDRTVHHHRLQLSAVGHRPSACYRNP